MEELTPTTIGVLMVVVVGLVEIAKSALRLAMRRRNGHNGERPVPVYESECMKVQRGINDSASKMEVYVQEQFREFGRRVAKLEQRADTHNEKKR